MGCGQSSINRKTFSGMLLLTDRPSACARSHVIGYSCVHVPLVISLAIFSAFSLGYLSANSSPTSCRFVQSLFRPGLPESAS